MSTQQKAYNIDPYYDDFSEDKRFYQILFRPGFSVQARELTQLQTILRDQFKKFGDHVFQQGSIVIPGNSFVDFSGLYAKLEANYLGTPIDVSLFQDKKIIGVDTGVAAMVRAAIPVEGTDPNTLIVNYMAAGNNGESTFNEGEEIYVEENISIRAKISSNSPFGSSTMAFINDGVYYVNGTFVKVVKQYVVVSKYDGSPSAHVLLKINESIITSDDDQSLLDPAQGEPNYAAPGSDRLKIDLTLVTLPITSDFGDDYVELMRFEEGVLVYHAKNPKYSELEKSLARRTYDESGDYLVYGLSPSLLEHIKLDKTKGVYPPPVGDKNKFVLKLTAGKAYIKGFEKEQIADTLLTVDKARTEDHIKNKSCSVIPAFGQIIYVSDFFGLPDTFNHETIYFYNSSNTLDVGAVEIGSAKAYAIEYKEGQGIYGLYVYGMTFSGTYTFEDIGGIQYGTSGSATVLQKLNVPNATDEYTVGETVSFNTRSAKVAYHDITTSTLYVYKNVSSSLSPKVGDNIVGGTSTASGIIKAKTVIQPRGTQSSPIIQVPLSPVASIRDANGDPDIVYQVYKYVTITTDINGNGSVNIDNGRIDALTQGSLLASWSGGSVALNKFSLSASGTTLGLIDGPHNTTVDIQVIVTKYEVTEKTKTLTTNVETALTLTGTTVKSADLAKADIYKLVSVISSIDGDVTDKFKLDNGQRNYYYDYGKIILNDETIPAGTLTVTYQYFEHSASGDYFCINSYRNSGIATSTELDFNSYVPNYFSTTDSNTYDLSACYDFRKIIGYAGDALMNEARITSSVDYYVGRIDLYGINTTGDIVYIRGIPEEIPEIPKAPSETLILGSYKVPAWTPNIKAINVKEEKVKRFTMKDINDLSTRIGYLEEYATLNALESDASKMEIVDPTTGLNRYKLGLLVDDFSDPSIISDYYNADFAAEYEDSVLKPAKEWVTSEFFLDSTNSTNYKRTGDIVTLPYQEVEFVVQPYSTKITNVNPFLVISWIGNMTLNPNADSWVETENLPDIVKNTSTTVYVTRPDNVQATPVIPATPITPTPVPAPVSQTPVQTPTVTVVPTATTVTPEPEPKVFAFWDSDLGYPAWIPLSQAKESNIQGPISLY